MLHTKTTLVLKPYFDTKGYIGSQGEIMRIWYIEDLLNTLETDNTGEICVDVDVLYSPADDDE